MTGVMQDREMSDNSQIETTRERSMRETTEHYDRVRHFMQLAQQDTPAQPQADLSIEVRMLRAELIMEEALETIEKGLGIEVRIRHEDGKLSRIFEEAGPLDLVELVDGCCDLSVVTAGTLIAAGITDAEPLRLVDENNLAKFGPGGYRREDGKWMKPPDHTPPDLAGEIERQRQAAIEGSGNSSPRNGLLSMIGALERAAVQRDHEAQELTAALDYSAQIPEEDARLLRKAARILQASYDPGNPPPPSRRRPMPPPSICLPTNWTEDPDWCQLVRVHLPDLWDQEQARRAACYHAGEPPASKQDDTEGRQVPPHRSSSSGFLPPDKTGAELRAAARVGFQKLMGTEGEDLRLPDRDPTKPAENQGLFHKFVVHRTDGADGPGGKHEGCPYFVLDTRCDPFAVPALHAYARACRETHPHLSDDLFRWVGGEHAVEHWQRRDDELRKFYHADGTFEVLPAAEVKRRRIEAAQNLEAYGRLREGLQTEINWLEMPVPGRDETHRCIAVRLRALLNRADGQPPGPPEPPPGPVPGKVG